MNGCYDISGSPGNGTITVLEYGYYQGINTTASSNTKYQLYTLQVPIVINNGINGDRMFSYSFPVKNTIAQYINGYVTLTGSLGSGTLQICILSYSIQRIG